MGRLLDTGVLIRLERGRLLSELEDAAEAAISVITVSELMHGAYRAPRELRGARLALIETLLGPFEALPITSVVARVHAELWTQLVSTGRMIGLHDAWIAATALAHGLQVVTTDARHFERVPGLDVRAVSA